MKHILEILDRIFSERAVLLAFFGGTLIGLFYMNINGVEPSVYVEGAFWAFLAMFARSSGVQSVQKETPVQSNNLEELEKLINRK